MKLLYILLIGLFSISLQAQDFSDEWTGYFSFANVGDVSEGNGRLYAASENAVFIFSTIDGSIITRSTINGLSGNRISSIYYSEAFDTLLIGYENGIIDIIVSNSENVITVVDIFNRLSIPPSRKSINHFTEFNGFVYISTGFGISLYDLGSLEFDDSYFIGDNGSQLNITQTTIQDEFIYASSTDGGVRRAIVNNDNIIDFNNWTTVTLGSFQGITSLNQTLYLANGNQLLRSTNGLTFLGFQQFQQGITDLEVNDDILSVTTPNSVQLFDSSGVSIESHTDLIEFDSPYSASVVFAGSIFLGTRGNGVARIPINNQGEITQLLPNGPLLNTPFNIEAVANELWVVYGEYTISYNPFPLTREGISHLTIQQGWNNIPFDDVLEATDLSYISVNPQNPSQVFVSSFQSGLLEINEDVPTILYDENNSSFTGIGANGSGVRLNGSTFDREGNLWVTNSRVPNIINRLSPGGQFTPFSFEQGLPNAIEALGIDDIVIASDGRIYIGTSSEGVAGFDPNTGEFGQLVGEEEAGNLPNNDVRALALDRNGTLWIGTRRGLRVLFSPSSIFTDPQASANAIIILEDDIPQELLNDQVVTAIVVDGANNKWVATADSGVFQFSPSGQETIFHFTEDNSPLPSNNVQDLAIDPQSGTIYFATTEGLVSFDGTTTGPAEDLENVVVYPNPVRPTFNGEVTIEGLTARTNVKITDLLGNLVHEENTIGGNITWDTRAFGRHKVASGVYLILITGPEALETQIAKLMIIR